MTKPIETDHLGPLGGECPYCRKAFKPNETATAVVTRFQTKGGQWSSIGPLHPACAKKLREGL